MSAPARRLLKTIMAFLAGWCMIVVIWSLASGETLRIIPENGFFFIALIVAFAVGALGRYFVETRADAKRNG